MITYRKTQGQQVVARAEGAYVGRLDDFQFDLSTREIYGYRLKGSGVFAKAGGVSALHLDQIGRDVAFVGTEAQVEWSGAPRNAEEGRAWASQYRGTRVMSRAGVALGEVDDFVFDAASRRVLAILLNNQRALELSGQVATGPAAVIVEDPSLLQDIPTEPQAAPEEWWRRLLGARAPTEPKAPQVEAPPPGPPTQVLPEDSGEL